MSRNQVGCNPIMKQTIHRGNLKWQYPKSESSVYKPITTGNDSFMRTSNLGANEVN